MFERPIPDPFERTKATRLCSRLKVQPTDFTPAEWLKIAVEAEEARMPDGHTAEDYLEIAALAERFPGMSFR